MNKTLLAAAVALALPVAALAAPAAPQDPAARGTAQVVSPRDKAKAARTQNRQAKGAKAKPAKPRAAKPAPDSKKAPAT